MNAGCVSREVFPASVSLLGSNSKSINVPLGAADGSGVDSVLELLVTSSCESSQAISSAVICGFTVGGVDDGNASAGTDLSTWATTADVEQEVRTLLSLAIVALTVGGVDDGATDAGAVLSTWVSTAGVEDIGCTNVISGEGG